jgi:hypothetical protein
MRLPWQKTTTAARRTKAAHVEIWEHFIDQNRLLRRIAVALSAITFVAVAGATWLALVAFHRPVVYYVNSEGQAVYGGRLGGAELPHDVEVRYVARRFVEHTLAFHSLTIQADLAEAWNLMTDELRDEQAAELARYESERGYSFVDFVKDQQIRTVLDISRIDVTNHNDETWAVRLSGLARTWPLNRVGEQAGFEARDFEAQLTLVRVPRTEHTANGLLVAKQSTRFFEPKDPAALLEDTVPAPEPGP